MRLSIIIPTANRPVHLKKTLHNAVVAIEGLDAEIIVINDSRNTFPSIPDHPHIRSAQNIGSGVAAARNFGSRLAQGELLLFLDDDILISTKSIQHILNVHSNQHHVALNVDWVYPPATQQMLRTNSFGRFLEAMGLTTFKGWYHHRSWRDNALFESTSVASFHLSLLKSDFEETRGYDERFPFAGFEDYDFPLKLKNAGCKFFIDTRIAVFHNEILHPDPDQWLSRQRRRATTRRVAVNLGYTELALNYGTVKASALTVLTWIEPALRRILHWIPDKKAFDFLYFRILATLEAKAIFDGYRDSPPVK